MKTPTSKVLDQKTSLLLTQIYKNKEHFYVAASQC